MSMSYLKKNKNTFVCFIIFSLFICFFNIYFDQSKAKTEYPILFTIENGSTVTKVANNLFEEGLIDSQILFKLSVFFYGGVVRYGNYYFTKKNSVFSLAYHITSTEEKTPIVRIEIPNGSNIFEIGNIIKKNFSDFDELDFIKKAEKYEGLLYPETYFLFQDETPTSQTIIKIMKKTFEIKTKELRKIYKNGLEFRKVLILASIVELESWKKEDQKKIAGVLKNRLEKGIPLQVDVSFKYINGKNSYTLTKKDLKIDNLYNTYLYKGLPPGPIGSPSIEAINSVINYTDSDYLFFLSDRYGNTYFSETLYQHNIYKQKYI